MIGLEHYLGLASALFVIGIFGLFLNRKNVIVLLMSIELMLLAVNINLVAFSSYLGDLTGQVFTLFVLTVAAAEAAVGLAILRRSLEEPLRQIVSNAGEEASVVLNKVAEGSGNFGYNAATGQFGDMIEMGILDPTKVTRMALQNASSIAGLMIITEAMLAELSKKEAPAHDHGGGGMGGMGGMDF